MTFHTFRTLLHVYIYPTSLIVLFVSFCAENGLRFFNHLTSRCFDRIPTSRQPPEYTADVTSPQHLTASPRSCSIVFHVGTTYDAPNLMA